MQEGSYTRIGYYSQSNVLIGLTIAALSTIAVLVYQQCSYFQLRKWLSHALEARKVDPALRPGDVRTLFANQELYVPRKDPTHSHSHSANVRTTAVTFFRQLALTLGVKEYSISSSRRDQNDGVPGTRLFWWVKDLDKKVTNDKEDGIRTYVDVDFHVDGLAADITGSAYPIALSTINPTKVAESSGEATYYFDDENRLRMELCGGGSYSHQLWDYTPDTITTSRRFLGIPYMTTVFSVHKRQIDEFRSLVVFTPLGTWHGMCALAINAFLLHVPLRRFTPVSNGWAHIKTSTKAGISHSIGRSNTYQEATFTAQEFETVLEHAKQSKQDANASQTGTWLGHDRGRGLIAAGYIRSAIPRKSAYTTSVERGVKDISTNIANYGDESERKTVHAFMTPVVDGACYAHTNTKENSKWGVQARITDLAKKPVVMSPFPTKVVSEFVDLLIADGPIILHDYDDVFEAQSRPTQRSLLAQGCSAGSAIADTVRSFLKKEPVAGIKDPRVISTIDPATKLDYSYRMRAVGERLKKYNWYAFKTPEEVATRVADMLCHSSYALEGDFSRMDGNVDSNVRTLLENNLLRRWFPGDDAVLELHKKQFNQAGVISGHAYEGGYARCSGSPETSAFNTTLTACTVYLKNRMLGLEPEEAFARIGIVGGDDSLVPGIPGIDKERDAIAFRSAARALGQTLTSETKTVGEPVTMLSRIFGAAWYGDPSSMCSPLRTLSKIHASANMPAGVTPAMKCFQKATSLLTTDANTPIIGDLARKMLTSGVPIPDRFKDTDQPHWLQFDTSWPNKFADWMDEVIQAEMPAFAHDHFSAWLADGEALKPPVCLVIEAPPGKRDVIVDGEFIPSSHLSDKSAANWSTFSDKSSVKLDGGETPSVSSSSTTRRRGKRGSRKQV